MTGTSFHFLALGLGYSARHWAVSARPCQRWPARLSATRRLETPRRRLTSSNGVDQNPCQWRRWQMGQRLNPKDLTQVTHLLISMPPRPTLIGQRHRILLKRMKRLRWVGYLSTTGVYGDHNGAWVNEQSQPCQPQARVQTRIKDEQDWLHLPPKKAVVHIFRLAGIYGPNRSAIETVYRGRTKRIIKKNHVFCRIHVDDISSAITTSILKTERRQVHRRRIYNLCDDHPAPSSNVVDYACHLVGVKPGPEIAIKDANLSAMARSFYQGCRRVDNRRIKRELGLRLKHCDYQSGLRAIARSASLSS